MRLTMLAAALALALPTLALAEAPPQGEAPKPPKVKKVCRYTPPPTGSNRPGKRRCRTAEEWRAEDRETLDYDRTDIGTPVRSQGINPPQGDK